MQCLPRTIIPFICVLLCSFTTESQDFYLQKKNKFKVKVERYQLPQISGYLLAANDSSITVAQGELVGLYANGNALPHNLYDIHTQISIPVSELQAVHNPKNRIIPVVLGAALGALVGAAAATTEDLLFDFYTLGLIEKEKERGNGGAIIGGAVIGAGVGFGVSVLIAPNRTKIDRNPRYYMPFQKRVNQKIEWEKVSVER